MNLGGSLSNARKKSGLSQEEVAEKLGVSRQTVSKWETGETVPDIRQSKRMSVLYSMSLDELIEFDADVREIQDIIEKPSEETEAKIDWTSAWGKKYPILIRYQSEVDTADFAAGLESMLSELGSRYHYGRLDAMLVLKDILYRVWKDGKSTDKNGQKRV
ncbi:MAG: helix-turn-helix transcriptional regulator [Oscillospiraceae bacterium]|nr:helix-turn-helix transcriptional regulator [Oscillospiraceae bacterium]